MSGWGATPEDWAHFDLVCGLTADLLPVVSNPHAEISPASKMKGLGKTPSILNRNGQVAGLKDWTGRTATPAMLKAWAAQPDYGICVQTRDVRALDIDVDDPEAARAIAVRAAELMGAELGDIPRRWRANSGKLLLAFRVAGGVLRKRSVRTAQGLIEFLAEGQQFVAVGTHPSGARYTWGQTGALPDEFPTLPAEAFEALWSTLVAEFGVEPERRAAEVREGSGAELEGVEDPIALWLADNWPTFGERGGRLYITCPWRDQHTGDSGDTETAWLLAGTGGYARGHFQCMHAHCSGRTDDDFTAAVGYVASLFPDVAAQEAQEARQARAEGRIAEAKVRLPLPGFKRDNQGRIEALLENVVAALKSVEACGVELRWDTFRGELVIGAEGDGWRPVKDADAGKLRMALAGIGFKPVGKEMMRDALTIVASDHEFDTAITWLEALPPWDGVERIDTFFPDYFGTANTAYTRAVGMYAWTAQVGRVMEPGCKADMIPVLVGEQGQRKSWGVASISPAPEFFAKISFHEKDDDLSRKMRGTLVAELDELKGLNSRDAESIKAWVTQTHERWVPKYMEYATVFPRRLLFYGTTNRHDFLGDETGERRWLPMVCGAVNVEAIIADREQLWAEALEVWRAGGIRYAEAEQLAKAEHHLFKGYDAWESRVADYLFTPGITGVAPCNLSQGVRTCEVLEIALGIPIGRQSRKESQRLSPIMTKLGMRYGTVRGGDRPHKAWVQVTGYKKDE